MAAEAAAAECAAAAESAAAAAEEAASPPSADVTAAAAAAADSPSDVPSLDTPSAEMVRRRGVNFFVLLRNFYYTFAEI